MSSRTLVVGDVHGCARELRKLVRKAEPTQVVLVGDLFTKGPDPVGVWSLIQAHQMFAVMGNHDERLLQCSDKAARRCAEKLEEAGVPWYPWVLALPLFREVGPFTVVHAALHPSGELDRTTMDMALYMRRWPFKNKGGPLWHKVYVGERRVIFGHDAVRGLVRHERSGEPWLIGLDTGCVYGGRLSGYLVETDEIVQVRAKRAYKPV